mgnify:CR=1 FL=1
MKKKILVLLLILVIISAGIAAYILLRDEKLVVSNKNIDSKETSKTNTKEKTPDGNWVIENTEDVFVGYQINEVFGGETVSKSAVGKTNNVTSTLTVDGLTMSNISVEADMTRLKSDEPRRDSKMRTEALETDKFPIATFVQTGELTFSEAPVKGKSIEVAVDGDLTLHGVTRATTISLIVFWDGKVIKVSGEKEIFLKDFDITPPDSSFVKTEDKGILKIQLLLIPA